LAIDPRHLLGLKARGERVTYSHREALLYALGVGFGRQPGQPGDLAFVFEGAGPRIAPTFASALVRIGFLSGCGWDESRLVPAFERLTLQRPLPAAASLLIDCEVQAVHDLGPENGALVVVQATARSAVDQQPLFALQRGVFARGDGGFGAALGPVAAPHGLPARPADLLCALAIAPEQALVYRLSGDMNPIHADPAVARAAGLPGPVLQNLCTLGVAARGVLETICEHDPTLITSFEGSFTGGVYPGDELRLELWQDANIVSFRALVPSRGRAVIDHGRCVLAA
jgi:acyl dehydratase